MQKSPYTNTTLLFAVFIAGLVIAPWPMGSNRDWAWPLLSCLYLLISLSLLFRLPAPATHHARIVLVLFATLLLWIAFQWLGVPGINHSISVDPFKTRTDFLLTLTYAATFYATVSLVQTDNRIRQVAYAVVIVGLLQALLGGAQQLMFDLARARGSFPNPNHFAGHLEIALGLAIGLMLALSQAASGSRFSLADFLTGPLGRLRIIIIILVVALVMSRSRMGNMAFFSSILITAAISFYYSRSFNRYAAILLVSILALDTLIIGNYFGIERLGERLREVGSDSSSQGRVELQTYNLRILKDHLWLGAGAGTYETAFAPYRDAAVSKRADHTEMDYMEFLIELGVIGALPLLGILLTGLHAQVRMLGSMSSTFDRGIAFGCLAGTVSLLIHGFGDVNLQIPANALLFVLLLALPIAMLERRRSPGVEGA